MLRPRGGQVHARLGGAVPRTSVTNAGRIGDIARLTTAVRPEGDGARVYATYENVAGGCLTAALPVIGL